MGVGSGRAAGDEGSTGTQGAAGSWPRDGEMRLVVEEGCRMSTGGSKVVYSRVGLRTLRYWTGLPM